MDCVSAILTLHGAHSGKENLRSTDRAAEADRPRCSQAARRKALAAITSVPQRGACSSAVLMQSGWSGCSSVRIPPGNAPQTREIIASRYSRWPAVVGAAALLFNSLTSALSACPCVQCQ
jgi:hypothetical protein